MLERALITIALLCGLITRSVHGQSTCDNFPKSHVLRTDYARFEVRNDNWPLFRANAYTITYGDEQSHNPLFGGSMWLFGEVSGEIHISGNSYSGLPLLSEGPYETRLDPDNCFGRRIFGLNRDDLQALVHRGTITPAVRDWPWQLGAPVLDGDGIVGNYSPRDGDIPLLRGEQMAWWVMNDYRTVRDSLALNLEVRASAFVLGGDGLAETTLFLDYDIVNKGTEPIVNARFGYELQPFIGPDFGGTDTTNVMVYVYGVDDKDERGRPGVPPAVGAVLTPGTGWDSHDIHASFFVDQQHLIPNFGYQILNHLHGLQWNGDVTYFGGVTRESVPTTGAPTRIMYPGDPVTVAYWSMENVFDTTPPVPAYRHGKPFWDIYQMFISAFSADISPEESVSVLVAVPWAKGESRLGSVAKLKQYAGIIRENADQLMSPSINAPEPPLAPAFELALTDIAPNPFSGSTTISFSTPIAAFIHIDVFDALGRKVGSVADGFFDSGTYSRPFDATHLSPGVYFVRFEIVGKVFTRSIVVM